MPSTTSKPATTLGARLIALVCGTLVLAVFAAYFGILIGAVFSIFQLLDFIISGRWDASHTTSAVLAVVLLLFALRIASRLAASVLGLVTQRHDGSQWVAQQSELLEPEPELSAVVDRVCERVGGKRPDEVRLSYDQRCYVVEQRSFSLKTQRRRVLVMGMPQMLTMTVGEVQVILAHELSHFRSGDTTLTVFLFRLAETARSHTEQLRQGRLWRIDPVYWYFNIFQHLFEWTSAPWRRSHELLADQASALAFGGALAAHTLLKDWFVEWKFEEASDGYLAAVELEAQSAAIASPGGADRSDGGDVDERQMEPLQSETVYEYFMNQWQDFAPESHDYLEQRLAELERPSFLEAQPTVGHRLQLMRSYPDISPIDTRYVLDLISEEQLLRVERKLSDKLIAERRRASESIADEVDRGAEQSRCNGRG